jgi:hypothetical protein
MATWSINPDDGTATINNSGVLSVTQNGAIGRSWEIIYTDDSGNTASTTVTQGHMILIPKSSSVIATYDGNPKSISFDIASGGVITKYRYKRHEAAINWAESLTNPTLTDVGKLDVQAYYEPTEFNCSLLNWSQTATITIEKAEGRVITAPTAINPDYSGSAQALVNAGSGTGTMLYKVDSGSWGTSIPTRTQIGSYTVYYKASASTNYNESASGSVVSIISQKQIVNVEARGQNGVTSAQFTLDILNSSSQIVTSLTSSNSSSIPSDSLKVTFNLQGTYAKYLNANYKIRIRGASVSVTIGSNTHYYSSFLYIGAQGRSSGSYTMPNATTVEDISCDAQ